MVYLVFFNFLNNELLSVEDQTDGVRQPVVATVKIVAW